MRRCGGVTQVSGEVTRPLCLTVLSSRTHLRSHGRIPLVLGFQMTLLRRSSPVPCLPNTRRQHHRRSSFPRSLFSALLQMRSILIDCLAGGLCSLRRQADSLEGPPLALGPHHYRSLHQRLRLAFGAILELYGLATQALELLQCSSFVIN